MEAPNEVYETVDSIHKTILGTKKPLESGCELVVILIDGA